MRFFSLLINVWKIIAFQKGAVYLITFLINLKDLAFLIILFSSIIYTRNLKLKKRENKLSKVEMTMYILTPIAIPVYGILHFYIIKDT